MTSETLDLKCYLNSKSVDCSNSSVPGTKLKSSCKLNHSLPNRQLKNSTELLCLPSGNWNGQLYNCVSSNLIFQ